jgi:molybdopterin-synthase adenylyltransferase
MALNPNSPFFHEEKHASLSEFSGRLITICGAGALGGNLTETLARMGYTNLRLIDKDRVDMRNLSTQPYSRAEVGAPKARSLANNLFRALQTKVEPVVTELTERNAAQLLKNSALVVDAFDNSAARAAVSRTTRELNLPCLHIGFSGDGLFGSGLWEPDYNVPSATPGDPCDYPLTRPLAMILAALAARALTDFWRTGTPTDFEITWNDMRVSGFA